MEATSTSIMAYFNGKRGEYSLLTRSELMESLLTKEYVEIEELKEKIFKKRLDYFLLANCLKEKMLCETGYKQLKRYFVYEVGMEDGKAKEAATLTGLIFVRINFCGTKIFSFRAD